MFQCAAQDRSSASASAARSACSLVPGTPIPKEHCNRPGHGQKFQLVFRAEDRGSFIGLPEVLVDSRLQLVGESDSDSAAKG